MTSKEYLQRYKKLSLKEENIQDDLEHFERQLSIYNNPNVYFHHHLLNEKTAAETQLKEVKTALKEIIKNIRQINDTFLQDLLVYRYIDFLSWEEVTEALNTKYTPHSLNNIKQYSHNKALELLQNILDNGTLKQ